MLLAGLLKSINETFDKPGSYVIREVHQAPELQGRVSFPSKGGPLPPELRAYAKDRTLRLGLDEDEFLFDVRRGLVSVLGATLEKLAARPDGGLKQLRRELDAAWDADVVPARPERSA